jgi:hypothetical protein
MRWIVGLALVSILGAVLSVAVQVEPVVSHPFYE